MKMEKSPVIGLTELCKNYRTISAVQNINLLLSSGECLALVGHNGAGKSTLIKIILGLVKPTSGRVRVLRTNPSDKSFNPMRRHIGFLPEQVLFQKTLTGRETLSFYARLKGLPHLDFESLLHRVDLLAAADRKVGTYSKGMRQRLGMAQALIGNPKLLVLDEPTSGLDPIARQNIYEIIDEEKSAGATVLISSHVLSELDERIDRVAILNGGRLVAEGSIPFLRQNIGMPVQITVTADPAGCEKISGCAHSDITVIRLAKDKLVFRCSPEEKLALMRHILISNTKIADMVVTEPTLEQVYTAYSRPDQMGGSND
ncbi:MAG: ABC transporter ATP-binding protein [Sneathiella sp.]|uniref:ABC transporter ATP-binding protein n=1 Tax=Sneathiella sp. TaxID=1964365 RepID=UPI003002056E